MFGEIHVPQLTARQTIRVGGRFGDRSQVSATCDSEVTSYLMSPVTPQEDSPRGWWDDVEDNGAPISIPFYARILIRQPLSLHGQIILDANNDTTTVDLDSWKGDVLVGTGNPLDLNHSGTPKVYSTNSTRTSSDRLGPYYTVPAAPDGGGAIGLVTFPLARQDCEPLSTCTGLYCSNLPVVTEAVFVNGEGIKLRFYGPIDVASTGSSIHMHPCNVWGAPITSIDYASQLTLSLDGRTMSVNGPSLPSGRYAFVHSANTDAGLVSSQLFNNADPVVPTFLYRFVLVAGSTSDNGCADFDGDGDVATDFDIEAFFAALAGTCPPLCIE
jgi:hypothetical protein